jgi:F0F1-type ATP synthase membrane subunit b/b'
MLAIFTNFVLAFAEGGEHGAAADSLYGQIEPYLNYPGFEAWRFLNLLIFVLIMIYLLRKPLSKAFKDKRDAIRSDLIKAEKARKEAEARLGAADLKLSGIEDEKVSIIDDAKAEAAAEKSRIEEEAEIDVERIRNQAATELARRTSQVEVQLRRFSADESIRLAEERIRSLMTPETDAGLVKSNIEAIGGLK